jgi:hypothetical protein
LLVVVLLVSLHFFFTSFATFTDGGTSTTATELDDPPS